MEASFYLLEDQNSNLPDLDTIISEFGKIHEERGKPDGDSLDMQIDSMMVELCTKLDIKYIKFDGDVFAFMSPDLEVNEEELKKMLGNITE